MHPELAAALTPVLRDLDETAGIRPDVRDESWVDDPRQTSAMLFGPDGTGMGIRVRLGDPPAAQVAEVADQVQEWAVEALWSLGRSTSWPPCPEHPDRHPLAAVARAGRAVWTCPVSGAEAGPVGGVAGPRPLR
jgi:hypothetical protein